MQKDFQNWHTLKGTLHESATRPFYNEREVWWCSLGANVGFEQDGKGKDFSRPILIIKGFSKEVFICVPLTTQSKKGKFYHTVSLPDGRLRNAILSQLRLIDTKRLQEKIGVVDEIQFGEIKKAVIRLLE